MIMIGYNKTIKITLSVLVFSFYQLSHLLWTIYLEKLRQAETEFYSFTVNMAFKAQ